MIIQECHEGLKSDEMGGIEVLLPNLEMTIFFLVYWQPSIKI